MAPLNYVVLDVETYWDSDYTLRKLTHEQYIRDRRFMCHGWGVHAVGSKVSRWLSDAQMRALAKSWDWSTTAIICHNTRFDGAILGWHYGIKPALWVDTMGMYRALHPALKSHSLAALGKHFGYGTKGDEVVNTLGKRVLTAYEYERLGVYCATGDDSDCHITARLFTNAWDSFPKFERAVMDMTLRMFIEPVFEVDPDVLKAFIKQHAAEKLALLQKANIDLKTIMSNDKFAEVLHSLGIEPPMKPSPRTPGKMIYAFAKTDAAMDELAEDEDPLVQAVVAARLGNKTTILESRAERLIDVSTRGTLPVPLNYWGAKITGRHSGADKLNMQNFTRGSALRRSLRAPKGYKVVVGDSSNIELRLVMAMAGQGDAVAKIRNKVDLYCDFATDIYGREITKADEDERFVGKQGMLSLQYSASAPKFFNMLRQKRHPLPFEQCEKVVQVYRTKHDAVVRLWRHCEKVVIPAIHRGQRVSVDVLGWFTTSEEGFSLPGMLGVQYPQLKRTYSEEKDSMEWQYNSGRGVRGLYGAKVVENLCQHAARQVVMFQGLLVSTRYRVIHSVHDELVCCVPEDEAEDCKAFMLQCLQTAPRWAGDALPVTGEVGVGDTYGAAK